MWDPPRTAEGQEALTGLRASLKGEIKAAWAEEALRRGIALAKSGDLEGAQRCYRQALDLDRNLVDAWVARGAAFANVGRFQEAISDFETALRAPTFSVPSR